MQVDHDGLGHSLWIACIWWLGCQCQNDANLTSITAVLLLQIKDDASWTGDIEALGRGLDVLIAVVVLNVPIAIFASRLRQGGLLSVQDVVLNVPRAWREDACRRRLGVCMATGVVIRVSELIR